MRRSTTAILACALAALACAGCRGGRASRPNLVLISIDSLRPDHLSAYGYSRQTSPTIDRLAREGVRFESAVSTTSWTLPAHAALFTGLYDSTHGLVDNGQRLAPELVTLAERLAAAGYHTAGFFGGPYLHPTFGLSDGFEVWESCMTAVPDELPEEALREESRARRARSHADVTGPRTLEKVARWADARPADRPFFLFVHLWDVHYDFIPPPPYDRMFDPGYAGSLSGAGFMTNPAVRPRMDPRDLQHLVALYDGEIRFTDHVLGEILAALGSRGLLADALVAVTADHGEEFFEHGRKGHQRTLFDEVVRIPLVLHAPGRLPAGRVVRDQVRIVDLAPTLLAAAGVPSPGSMEGRDLLPLARGEVAAPRSALLELYADGRDQRALRTLGRKAYARGTRAGHRLPDVLYDLARDPRERAPRPREGDPEAEAAFAELDAAAGAALARRGELGVRARPAAVDAETRGRLRELGYLEETAAE